MKFAITWFHHAILGKSYGKPNKFTLTSKNSVITSLTTKTPYQ
jgi:hypothetical protein